MTQKMPTITVADIVAVYIERDDQLLLIMEPSKGLYWKPITGRLEPNEDLETCARREIREEIGCEVGVLTLFGTLIGGRGREGDILRWNLYRTTELYGEPTPNREEGIERILWTPAQEYINRKLQPIAPTQLGYERIQAYAKSRFSI